MRRFSLQFSSWKYLLLLAAPFWLFNIAGCEKPSSNPMVKPPAPFIQAVDLSSFPEISLSDAAYLNEAGDSIDLLDFVKSKQVNTIRLRLWVNPAKPHSGLPEVSVFSKKCRAKGFKIWLTLHYSDTWADPAQQVIPVAWQSLSYSVLKDSVYSYTFRVMQEVNPDIIQIGNEINSGFLHPQGLLSQQTNQFVDLIAEGIRAVRNSNSTTSIMLHYAGHQHSLAFFTPFQSLDFDLIGLSYYPKWHGKSLIELQQSCNNLAQQINKPIVIAETAYPFTLNWNDLTHNAVGLNSQLIEPEFPASPIGQFEYLKRLKSIVREIPQNRGYGICYWGAELLAWKGPFSTEGSSWENQALFDFDHRALPAWEAFNREP